jgi:hypothetical protein
MEVKVSNSTSASETKPRHKSNTTQSAKVGVQQPYSGSWTNCDAETSSLFTMAARLMQAFATANK